MLEVIEITAGYGNKAVLSSVSMQISKGELVALVGSNGSGKSTLLKSICGLIRPFSGRILFEGEDITGLETFRIVDRGIVLIPEGRHVFPHMNVRENLELGAFNLRARKNMAQSLEMVYELFPVLKERSHQLAGSLSGGEQQMLAIGRGLMRGPKLLMLDEPSLGLAPIMVKKVFDTIVEIKRRGTTVMLVEQNVRSSLMIADRAYVLENGRMVMCGAASELLSHEHLKKAYLAL